MHTKAKFSPALHALCVRSSVSSKDCAALCIMQTVPCADPTVGPVHDGIIYEQALLGLPYTHVCVLG